MKKITLLPLLLIVGTLGAATETSQSEQSTSDKVMAVISKAGDIQRTFEYIKDKLVPLAETILPAMDKTMGCALAKQVKFDEAPPQCSGVLKDLKDRDLLSPLTTFNQKLCMVPLTSDPKTPPIKVIGCKDYASFVTREARLAYSSTLTIYMMSLIMNGFLANKEGKVKGAIPSILEIVEILIPNSKPEYKAKIAAAKGSLADMNNTFEAIMRALKKISESMMYAAKAAETKIDVLKKEAELARLKKSDPVAAKKIEAAVKAAEKAQALADLNPFSPEPLEVGGDMLPEMPAEMPAEEAAPTEEAAE
jgi:hypothetical protein